MTPIQSNLITVFGFPVGGILKHGFSSGKQIQQGVQTRSDYSVVTRERIVAQYIMTNNVTATVDDMKV